MKRYRVGGCWKLTLVEFDDAEMCDANGRRPSDRLMGMLLTPEDAQRVVEALNDRSLR